jgi:hypothetical protein
MPVRVAISLLHNIWLQASMMATPSPLTRTMLGLDFWLHYCCCQRRTIRVTPLTKPPDGEDNITHPVYGES